MKKAADYLCTSLSQQGHKAIALHGGKNQEQREENLKLFKEGSQFEGRNDKKSASYQMLTNWFSKTVFEFLGVPKVFISPCAGNLNFLRHENGRLPKSLVPDLAVKVIYLFLAG